MCYHWATRSTRKSCWIMLTWWENGCCKCHLKNFDMSWSRHKHTLWCLLPGSNPRSLGFKASVLPLSHALDLKMLLNYVEMVRKCVLQMSFEKFGHVLTLAQTRTLACLLPGLNECSTTKPCTRLENVAELCWHYILIVRKRSADGDKNQNSLHLSF